MKKNTLILIAADAPQSGKSTVAKYLYNYIRDVMRVNVQQQTFAAPLKAMLATLFYGSLDHSNTEVNAALNGDNKLGQVKNLQSEVTYRKLMQTLGTEWRESTGVPTLWGEIMLSRLRDLKPTGQFVIVDDFRFPLEGNFLLENLNPEEWVVKTVRVTREKAEAVTGHSSEGGLKDWVFDCVIDNNGTVTALYEKVKAVLYEGGVLC